MNKVSAPSEQRMSIRERVSIEQYCIGGVVNVRGDKDGCSLGAIEREDTSCAQPALSLSFGVHGLSQHEIPKWVLCCRPRRRQVAEAKGVKATSATIFRACTAGISGRWHG